MSSATKTNAEFAQDNFILMQKLTALELELKVYKDAAVRLHRISGAALNNATVIKSRFENIKEYMNDKKDEER